MRLVLAGPEHDEKLRAFYHQFVIAGPVDLKIERPRSFFSPYIIQSDRYCTFILEENDSSEILGCVSFVIQDVMLGDKKQTVAIGRDLRIAQNRKAILGWGELFLPLIQELKDHHHVDHLFSTLNMSETKALNTFVRPRQIKRPFPRYHLYRRFNLITLHGRWPWARSPLPSVRIIRASSSREEELMYYMLQKTTKMDLLPWFDRKTILAQFDRWQDLKLSDFLVAVDPHDNIVGCLAPWRSHQVQSLIPYNYDLRAHNFRQFLKFGNLWGWTRPLTKPVNRLKLETSLQMTYLNFVLSDHPDIFETLLDAAFDSAGPNDFLVYLQMRDQIHLRPPLHWITAKIPYGLYCLIPPESPTPEFLEPSNDHSVYLEPFFV
ncbi:MAG: hypothetical protein IPK04_07625 [Bdellovibrionales bacterium]|jgi:hypothetical protein|nr:hypothetical protein [Bdellovibrionales bacterium]MBL7671973.1 hypothetical protein [Pseudobdellovibrionaceae bacterium]